jgi:hypothetical protein
MTNQPNHRLTAIQATEALKTAIKAKNKKAILKAYDLVESEAFSWDNLDAEFNEFDNLAETANDILYED